MIRGIYLIIFSWVMMLIGILTIGIVDKYYDNPWVVVATGAVVVALWSIAVYEVAKVLLRERH